MVMGGSLANGDILESTEIFSNNVWSIVPTARVKVTRVLNSVLTIHNRVFIFGIILCPIHRKNSMFRWMEQICL